jgi:hypothetical protein
MIFAETEVQRIIEWAWTEVPLHVSDVELDAFVVMPNHVHGVLLLTDGRAERVCRTAACSGPTDPSQANTRPTPNT